VGLEGLTAAGYTWDYEVVGEAAVISAEMGVLALPENAPLGGRKQVGSALSIIALSPGKAVVHLRLQRSWEKDRKPLKEIDLHISVSE
jgi:predicted secreted protein